MAARALSLGLLGACALAAGATGCKGSATEPPLSKNAPVDEAIPNVPVPPEEGPKLYATRPGTKVLERPAKGARAIGELRVGAPVARAAKPYGTSDCEGGWYPVRPRGFVCVGEAASLTAGPVLPAPRFDRALPYRYARLTSASPLYERLPSVDEQVESEPAIEKHFGKLAKADKESLGTGANDVPLDARSNPIGLPVLAKTGEGVGANGERTSETYFADLPSLLPSPSRADQLQAPIVAAVLRKGAGVAIADVITSDGPSGARTFGVTPSGHMIPLDRVEPELGSTWRGVVLNDPAAERELPIAFTLRHEVYPYDLDGKDVERLEDEELGRRNAVNLSGRFRTVHSVRYDETERGRWVRAKDIAKVVKRSKFPDFVEAGTRWIDVSLALQTLTLYEGRKAVYVTMISSGADVLGDPETSSSTPRGTFTLERAAVTQDRLDPKEIKDAFEVLDVPWVLGLTGDVQIFGAYFADRSGEARYHNDIVLTPVDAKRVFAWAAGEVPTGWASWEIPEDQRVSVLVRP